MMDYYWKSFVLLPYQFEVHYFQKIRYELKKLIDV